MRKHAFRGGGAAPSKAGTRTRPSYLRFLLKNRKILKKAEKAFDFSPIACKLSFEIAFLPDRNPVSSSFYRLFQQKCEKTRQVIFVSFATRIEIPAQEDCIFVSCWTFFCRPGSRFLAGPSRTRTGKRPAFLCSNIKILNMFPQLSLPLPHSKRFPKL